MRRYFFLILFALVLLVPMLLGVAMGVGSRATGSGKKESTLVIMTPHNEGIRREFKEKFVEWHKKKYGTPADVDYQFNGGSDIVKYFQDADRAHVPFGVDLVWGGGDFLFDVQLKSYLEPVTLDPQLIAKAFPKPDLNGVRLYDFHPDGSPPAWYGAALSSFGILYNKDVLKYLGLPEPKTWADLADPRYRNWIVGADPTRSASSKQAYMIIVERAMADAALQGRPEADGWADGMGLVRLICSNVRMFVGYSESVPGIVATGDAAAGMCIDFFARSQVDSIGETRLGYVEPAGATAINPDPIALVKGAPHAELAKHFIEYVLTEEGQFLWNARLGTPGGPRETTLRRLPVMPASYARIADFTDHVNPYAEAGTFNKSSDRERTFGILGELIEFSCIDLLAELRDTRRLIVDSPKRAELERQLGTFPFNEDEAKRRLDKWKKSKPAEQLQLQRDWVKAFRDEYAKLREEAKS